MPTYRVAFDGKWQGDFDDQEDALAWAREVGETGRIVHVATRRLSGMKLMAIFPESQYETGKRLWKARTTFGGGAPVGAGP